MHQYQRYKNIKLLHLYKGGQHEDRVAETWIHKRLIKVFKIVLYKNLFLYLRRKDPFFKVSFCLLNKTEFNSGVLNKNISLFLQNTPR